jgi:hypothetical protein
MRSKKNIILHRLLKEEKRRDGRRRRRRRSRKRSHQHITGSECKGLISRSTTSKRMTRGQTELILGFHKTTILAGTAATSPEVGKQNPRRRTRTTLRCQLKKRREKERI